MKYFVICIMLLLVISCDKRQEDIKVAIPLKDTVVNDFFPGYTGGNIKPDTLYLYTRLDDCGEWGGPKDEYKIYVDSANRYHLDFKRFKFNCDSIGYYHNLEKLPLEKQKNIVLDEKSKVVISDFCVQIMKAKIKEQVNSNAGSIYMLHSVDSTLNISIYSEKNKIKNDYIDFKKKLGLLYTDTISSKKL